MKDREKWGSLTDLRSSSLEDDVEGPTGVKALLPPLRLQVDAAGNERFDTQLRL